MSLVIEPLYWDVEFNLVGYKHHVEMGNSDSPH